MVRRRIPVGDADPVAIEADDVPVGDFVEEADGAAGIGRDQRDVPRGAAYKARAGGLRLFADVLKTLNG